MARSGKPSKTNTKPKTDAKPAKAEAARPAEAKAPKGAVAKASEAKAPKAAPKSAASKPNVLARFTRYIRDVRSEMGRVVWPTRPEVVNSSIIVVVTLVATIIFVLVIDQVSSFLLLEQLPKIFGLG